MKLILASKSASRRAMLDAAGVTYDSIPADIDERAVEAGLAGAAPDEVAEALAVAKAAAVAALHPGALVLWSARAAASTSPQAARRLANICGSFRAV